MLAKTDNGDRRLDLGCQTKFQSSMYVQPWWHGVVSNDAMGETTSKVSSADHLNGSIAGGDGGQGDHLKHVSSTTAVTMGKNADLNSHLELVGHSIVLTSYPYSDPQYGAMLASYAPQAVVSPHLYGIHQGRMLLPLEMEEEPVYVNAKQYHGILRRRQSRAKAELEKKVIKVRKPYLHESRHLHAMRRARGSGGRFLNTKKLENNSAKLTSEKDSNQGANATRNLDSTKKQISESCNNSRGFQTRP